MKTISTLIFISVFAVTTPAIADSIQENSQDIQADINAIHKDNEALRRDLDKLEKDRSVKASAKANNEYGKQAEKSLAIGADKTAIEEKKAEKKADQKILEHHQEEMNENINAEKQDSDTHATDGSEQ
jgi:hypothetical protein